jgi:hypothetical protein
MKVISFSIWGDSPLYCDGALANLEIAKRIYPGWTCRFYHDLTVPPHIVGELATQGAETVLIQTARGKWDGLFWRFYPIDDPSVEAFIVRDTDSRLTTRERNAVEEWIASNKGLHTMRDHWNHNVPVLGGMWGMKRGAVGGVLDFLKSWTFEEKGTDQTFLDKYLWPQAREIALAHDRYPLGMYRLPDRTFRMPDQVSIHNRHDFCGNAEREFPRGKIVLKDGTVFQRLDVYAYDPPHLFGPHEIRPFPPGALEYGHFIGEPTFDFDKPYDDFYQDYVAAPVP